ncbi:MAG TPA: hypothetical protein VGA04_32125 [Streptosporangiaceae bacterium]
MREGGAAGYATAPGMLGPWTAWGVLTPDELPLHEGLPAIAHERRGEHKSPDEVRRFGGRIHAGGRDPRQLSRDLRVRLSRG